jgi:hypothetical protein
MPFIVTVSIRGHKRAAIAERVKGPDTTAVPSQKRSIQAKMRGSSVIHGIAPKCCQKSIRCSSGTGVQ